MKEIICLIFGHKWGKFKKIKGWTTDHNKHNRFAIKTYYYRSKCQRCGEEEFWANTSIKR